MEVDYENYEIVSVFQDYALIDAESYQRNYQTYNGRPLPAGYYVVNWPEHVRVRRFDERAVFHGPFPSRLEATSALQQLTVDAAAFRRHVLP
ncbi:hypothetical protein NP603_06850 [Methylomonas sp. SURF-1]|uniref:Uncharacterized protein n=1 Tax=Methylomonas aurea TaxID=2952224 RepID=A0ABT1UF10_9GAMM|nr:hypothetical protein [Methylomonas sp. SURF-1]MCQ8180819.1 hypothetical protein [Methylomonas sp. SURF-1]